MPCANVTVGDNPQSACPADISFYTKETFLSPNDASIRSNFFWHLDFLFSIIDFA